MSLIRRLAHRFRRQDTFEETLTLARCYDCGLRFWGVTEIDATHQLSRHAAFEHGVPPLTEEEEEYYAVCVTDAGIRGVSADHVILDEISDWSR